MTNPIDARYLTAKQTAAYLGISVFSIYRLVERRAVPFIPLHPSKAGFKQRPAIRFDVQALDIWMRAQTVKPMTAFIDELTPKH